jgi:hypothetical protein
MKNGGHRPFHLCETPTDRMGKIIKDAHDLRDFLSYSRQNRTPQSRAYLTL